MSLSIVRPGNAAELRVLEAAGNGEWAEFTPNETAVLNAHFLRCLFLEFPWGLRIKGAHIRGKFDLIDQVGNGSAALPPLMLEVCRIPDGIDVSYAKLKRFSITGSHTAFVEAHGVCLEGPFDFSGIRGCGASADDSYAWVNAAAAQINDVKANGARLRAPGPSNAIGFEERQYALNLADCHVTGDIELRDLHAHGGVNLSGSEVHGDVWLTRANLVAIEEHAFRADNAQFGSTLNLDAGFRAKGLVLLVGAKIETALHCEDGTFENPSDDFTSRALLASHSNIGVVSLTGQNFRAIGEINFYGVKVRGDFDCSDATFENRRVADGNGVALNLETAVVEGHVFLSRSTAAGQVLLSGAKIGHDIACGGATLENKTDSGMGIAFTIEGATVGGSVILYAAKVSGQLVLSSSTITHDLDCWKANVNNSIGTQPAVFGIHANIGKSSFRCARVTGQIKLDGTHIDQDLDAEEATFAGRKYAIYAERLEVRGHLSLDGAKVFGSIGLRFCQVEGAFVWSSRKQFTFLKQYEDREGGQVYKYLGERVVDLEGARITTFKTKLFAPETKVKIVLRAARAATINDRWPCGWGGGDAVEEKMIKLDLDGFSYDHTFDEGYGDEVSERQAANAHRALRDRLAWLSLQTPSADGSIPPQPYRQLAYVLRTHGQDEEAREVAIGEKRRMLGASWGTRWWHHPILSCFGAFFGFGLSPRRALCTIGVFFLLGWLGVEAARYTGLMMITTTPVATKLLDAGESRQAAIENGEAGEATIEEPCKSQIEPFFYAIDLMLPVIPLHQESVCDISTKYSDRWYRRLKLAYSILGKILVTLALITFSGVLRIRAESND